MRKFKITNADGLVLDLMDKTSFLSSPDGLGFDLNCDFNEVGDSYLPLKSRSAQKEIGGTLIIKGYSKYQQVSALLVKNPVTLHYCPIGTLWYTLPCLVRSLSKTELDNGYLRCDIRFSALSKWTRNTENRRTSPTIDNPKQYGYRYPYIYMDNVSGSINLMNQGYEDSPLIITVFGAVENPRWDLIVNGNVIATGELQGVTIQKGNKLVVNSEDGNLEIAEYTLNNEYVRNLYEYSNFETERFIKVPPGRSAIRIYGTTSGEIVAYVEVLEQYETV